MPEHRGLGVMIQALSGDEEGRKALENSLLKIIIGLSISEDQTCLRFEFADGSALEAFDNGQSCCESRYMSTDDNLQDYIGGDFYGLEVREGPGGEAEYDCHDTEFLIVRTSKGEFTIVNHNEHNGYYGGFWITVREK